MRAFIVLLGIFFIPSAFAQVVEVQEERIIEPGSGREKAAGYFKDRKSNGAAGVPKRSGDGGTPRYLAVHAGTFFSDQAYKWGKGDQTKLGKLNFGVDYRLGEWVNTADLSLRLDFTAFELDEGQARKLSVTALLAFPDANSRFPLYFGLTAGPGFFLKQIRNESAVSLDYGLVAGVRLFDLIDQLGFMFEVGLKDHLHLFSDGQYSGIYFNVGTVFAF